MMPEAAQLRKEVEFQYEDLREQTTTSIAGMWLFLATEALFFGGLFLVWLTYRIQYPAGFAAAAAHSEFGIGTVNTVVLMTSSAAFACCVPAARLGRNGLVFRLCLLAILLGLVFMGLKLFEWHEDIQEGLVPGPGFSLGAPAPMGAALFWLFYYIGTVLHMIHLVIGIGLVGWIAFGAARHRFTALTYAPVEAVGLYWSFVDLVWMVLYALIYLGAR
jgi:cytochrome c oxidase subunit III